MSIVLMVYSVKAAPERPKIYKSIGIGSEDL